MGYRNFLLIVLSLVLLSQSGCNSKPETREYPISITSPVDKARGLLERYVEGTPVASEITAFDAIVSDLKESDGEMASVVNEVLEKLKANPRNAKQIASEALKKFP